MNYEEFEEEVKKALQSLKKKGYVKFYNDGTVGLTKKGKLQQMQILNKLTKDYAV